MFLITLISVFINLYSINNIIMTPRTRINEATCPVRIVSIAKPYGFKTIGSFYKFLKQCNPNAKLYFGTTYMRASQVLRVVDKYLGINDLYSF